MGACSSGGAKRESTMIAAASRQAGGCTGGCRGKDRDAQIAPVGERGSRGEEGCYVQSEVDIHFWGGGLENRENEFGVNL